MWPIKLQLNCNYNIISATVVTFPWINLDKLRKDYIKSLKEVCDSTSLRHSSLVCDNNPIFFNGHELLGADQIL